MKTIGAIILLILLTAYLWLVVSLTLPTGPRPLVWTVAPATSAPLSRDRFRQFLTSRMFGCLDVWVAKAVGEGPYA